MKTSKEMQLKVADRIKENIEEGEHIYRGIQVRSPITYSWVQLENLTSCAFSTYEFRFEPQTITINGVEIPKPLRDSEILEDEVYYHVANSKFLYGARHGKFIADQGIRFVYETTEEAIKASKLLFGIED